MEMVQWRELRSWVMSLLAWHGDRMTGVLLHLTPVEVSPFGELGIDEKYQKRFP